MSLILNGSSGVSDVDGSASTPAIRGTDTNTGMFFPAADTIAFAEGGTEVMRIDSSGNVGIGTSSPFADSGYKSTQINGTSTGSQINLSLNGTVYGQIVSNATNGLVLNAAQNTPMLYFTGGSERMRIDSSGDLLVGTTSAISFAKQTIQFTTGRNGLAISTPDNINATDFAVFRANGATCGTITRVGTTSAVSYVTTSDYRLKENIAPMTGALAKVAQLKPCTYTWKVDGSDGQGFIAHELAEVVPDCVTGEKDAVDADGNPKYQGIDTSFLVATLTAALQEAHGLIKDLQARVESLESK